MYSDNHFEDLAFEPTSANPGYSSTFDINDFGLSTELFSDPTYHASSSSSNNNNPLLQTIQRNTASTSTSGSSRLVVDYSSSHLGGVGRGTAGSLNNNNENDDPSNGIGNALLGSPQPSTVKKLKSHLSGIGGIGGYLTSPMGSFRQHNHNNDNTNASPAYSVLKPTSLSSNSNLNMVHGSMGSSPLKPIHSSSQQHQQHNQDPACLELRTPLPPMPQPMHGNSMHYSADNNINNAGLSAPNMQRLQSAPASTSTSSGSGRSSSKSKKHNNNENLNVPQSATSSTFNEMDYGGMRIYGRPIQRSASEDPSNASYNNNNGQNMSDNGNSNTTTAGFLPYPDQLPTLTLGRGVKNSRDINNNSSSFPMSKSDSEPIPQQRQLAAPPSTSTVTKKGFTNLDKPFIQYVAPNSPAGKTAAAGARNKKALTVRTTSGSQSHQLNDGNSTASASAATSNGKMVPIRMARQAHEMPLTPPISANSMISPPTRSSSQMQSFQSLQQYGSQQQQQQMDSYQNQSQQQQENRQYFSPVKNTFDFSTAEHQGQYGLGVTGGPQQQHSNLPPNMPSFEFSLEQFGGHSLSDNDQHILNSYGNNNQNSNNGNNSNIYNGNAIDFSSVLGLPSPSHHHNQESHSSAGSSHHHGLLSPPPHSAASTHSSVFSDDQALLFGIPPTSPYFGSQQQDDQQSQQQSIDQALASLLGTTTTTTGQTTLPDRGNSSTPQPQQLNMQAFSPSHQQTQMFSPNLQQQSRHQGQIALGISSPPMSPQHGNMTSPAQSTSWAPYQQQTNMQNLLPNIDPSLQSHDSHQHHQQDPSMLSPQSAHYSTGNSNHYSHHNNYQAQQQQMNHHHHTENGRLMSSPRRLRGMQSAPDLNALYSDASNGFNEAFGITATSPSPRKPSLKRGRGNMYGDDGDSDEENQDGYPTSSHGGYTQYGDGSSEQDDEDDEYNPSGRNGGYDRPPPRKRANSIHSGGKVDPNFHHHQNNNNAVAAVLLPLVNPNPARLRPGPKPKTSLPNLQAAHQGVFQVSPRAPPVPAFPPQFLVASPNPSNAESSGTTPGGGNGTVGCLSPDPDTGFLRPQGGVSKDMLATFYQVGTGSKQTKKGKPQRMYICSIPGCEKEFPRKSAVESHIQTHLEDKPFACPYDGW